MEVTIFEFTREDIAKVIEHPAFELAHKIMLEECFNDMGKEGNYGFRDFFRGDHSLFTLIDDKTKDEKFNILKEYSFPYLSPCEDYEYYKTSQYYTLDSQAAISVKTDNEERLFLIDKAKDKLDPAWWCFYHQCRDQANIIMHTILKILFPNQKFYLYDGLMHSFIINRPLGEYKGVKTGKLGRPLDENGEVTDLCIFDLASQFFGFNVDLCFPGDKLCDIAHCTCTHEDHSKIDELRNINPFPDAFHVSRYESLRICLIRWRYQSTHIGMDRITYTKLQKLLYP